MTTLETTSNIEVASTSELDDGQLYAILAAVAIVVLLLCCGVAVCIVVRRSRAEQRGKIGPQDGGRRLSLFPEKEETPMALKGPDRKPSGPVAAGLLRARSSYFDGAAAVGPMDLTSMVKSRRSLAAATQSCRRSAASARMSAGDQRASASGIRLSTTDVCSMLPSVRRSYVEDHDVHVIAQSSFAVGEIQQSAWSAPIEVEWATESVAAPTAPTSSKLPWKKRSRQLAESKGSSVPVSTGSTSKTTEVMLSMDRHALDVGPAILTARARRSSEEEPGRNRDASVDSDDGHFEQLRGLHRQQTGNSKDGSRGSKLKSTRLDSGFFPPQQPRDRETSVDSMDEPPERLHRQQMGTSRDGSRESSMKSTRLDSGFFDLQPDPAQQRGRETSLDPTDEPVTSRQMKWLQGQMMKSSRDGSRGSKLKSTRLDSGFFPPQQPRDRETSVDSMDEPPERLHRQQMGTSRDGSRESSMKSTRLDSGFFDLQPDPAQQRGRETSLDSTDEPPERLHRQQMGTSRDGSRESSMKSTQLDSGFFDEPSTEPLGAFRPPPLASMRSAGSSGSLGGRSSGLRSARLDDNFFAGTQAAAPPPMIRGRSAPDVNTISGGPLSSKARWKSPLSPLSTPFTAEEASDTERKSRKKTSKVKFEGPSLQRAGSSADSLGTPRQSHGSSVGPQRPSLLRGTSAPSLGMDGSESPRRKSANDVLRRGSARDLFSGGQRPDGSTAPGSPTTPESLMRRQQSLVTTNL